jgi:hypothetical protein
MIVGFAETREEINCLHDAIMTNATSKSLKSISIDSNLNVTLLSSMLVDLSGAD